MQKFTNKIRRNIFPKQLFANCFSTVPFYGGAQKLVNLVSNENTHQETNIQIPLSWRQRCDMELLVTGALTPLDQYMDKKTYQSVCENNSLPNGILFPIPFVLEVPKNLEKDIQKSNNIVTLTDDRDGTKLATVQITDLWDPDFKAEIAAYGGDPEHPEVQRINEKLRGKFLYAGGKFISCWAMQKWQDYNEYRQHPADVRQILANKGWDRVVAFQTRNPMHYAHIELVKRAAKEHNCDILLNPVSGPTKDGDVDYQTRMKAYQAVLPSFDLQKTQLVLLPLAMRMGGPREALLHMIIRQNYGASHFIIGRDHAGPGSNSKGKDFYEPYDARDTVMDNASKFAIKPIPFDMVVYVEKDKKYYLQSEVPKGTQVMKLSGTEVRRRLREGIDIPEWFSPPHVVKILRQKFESDKWKDLNDKLESKSPKDIIKHALETFGKDVAISFSGAEDVILIEYAKQTGLPFRVFSLDTGRLHPETYRLFDAVEKHYNIKIEYTFPNAEQVQNLVRNKGMFSFFKDGHNECCTIRKVNPLRQQLSGLKAWITGLRKDQSVTRTEIPVVMIDGMFKGQNDGNLIKYNPLSNASQSDVWWDIRYFKTPFNQLHEKGFVSIGCEPCTKVTIPSQHEREGRWWWEEATQKECGLHAKK